MAEKFKVSIASDHAGFAMKKKIVEYLESNDFSLIDRGPDSSDPVDYPDFAKKVCNDLVEEDADRGILICGSGQGMAMVANKYKGIRAALCVSEEMTELARAHNDANILTLGARLVDESTVISCVDKFFSTPFEGDRHIKRVNKIG
jgi:ribose 5-phosphate isomerase B